MKKNYPIRSGATAVRLASLSLLAAATLAGCGGSSRDPLLGVPAVTAAVQTNATRPRITRTVPATVIPGPATGAASNAAISATFSKAMTASSINTSSFTLSCAAPCVAPQGTVSYAVDSRTAVFSPVAPLTIGTTYTATVTTAATDLSGNALAGNQGALPAASNYAWRFTVGAAAPAGNPVVTSTRPSADATGVCPATAITARFSVPSGLEMDPSSINASTFTVTGPSAVSAASVTLDDATGTIATFTPANTLTAGTTYTATLKSGSSGVRDLTSPGNTMTSDVSWRFTTGTSASCQAGALTPGQFPLGAAVTFGTFGGSAGVTNMGILTLINGDIGTTAISTSVTGLHDAGPGCTYTETGSNAGFVNGLIYTAAPPPTAACPSEGNASTFAIATKVRADALTLYNALAALPAGSDPGAGSLSGLVLAPGVYTAASGSFKLQGSDLTLDAQGNPNAVFVFQMASSLTVGGPGAAFPRNIILVGGAQAKNVFWQVGSAATINAAGGGTMVGTIVSQAGAAFSTAGNVDLLTLNGRALSLGASVTLVNTVINVPAP
ncbi:ice-binding family protein [Actimicrobium sp. CCC2.4]|uniref:ice-binding family protein n=1 Tax=Actimicrobium sp. CCC2.4 TaxID=3048606 RepID=UPI002AC8C97D|nr:ice-binding family protein [Actimicrobium sp. CCC2.4]MEB0136668.1 ice-binding family protein [Actimicrobium sp. CCC2.4]WPX31649.1 ice-binding family protein [Actimicrobium sp. CCC2.4]